MRRLLVPVVENGACIYHFPSAMDIRDICAKEKETLWPEHKRLENPAKVYVDLSDRLYEMKKDVLNHLSSVKY